MTASTAVLPALPFERSASRLQRPAATDAQQPETPAAEPPRGAPDPRQLKRSKAFRHARTPSPQVKSPLSLKSPGKASSIPNPYAVSGRHHHHPGATAKATRATFAAWSLLALGRSVVGVLQVPFAAITSLTCLLCALHDAYATGKGARDASKDHAQLHAMHLGALNALVQARNTLQSPGNDAEHKQAQAVLEMAEMTLGIIDELLGNLEKRYLREPDAKGRAEARAEQREKARNDGLVPVSKEAPALVAPVGLEPGWSPFKGMAPGQIAFFRDVTLTAITAPAGAATIALGLTSAVIGPTADLASATLGLNAFLFPFGVVAGHANLHAARKAVGAARKAKTTQLAQLGDMQEFKNQLDKLHAQGRLGEEDHRIASTIAGGFRHRLLEQMNTTKRNRQLGIVRAIHGGWTKYAGGTVGTVALAALLAAMATTAAAATSGVAVIVAAAVGGVTIVPALGSLAYGIHKSKQEKDEAKADQMAAEEAINHWGPAGVGKFLGASDVARVAMVAAWLRMSPDTPAVRALAANLADNPYLHIEYLSHELHRLSHSAPDEAPQDASLAILLLRRKGMSQQQIDYLLQSGELLGGQHRDVCRQRVAQAYGKELYESDRLPGKPVHDLAHTQQVMKRFVLQCKSPELLALLEKTPEEWNTYHDSLSPEQRTALGHALKKAQEQLREAGGRGGRAIAGPPRETGSGACQGDRRRCAHQQPAGRRSRRPSRQEPRDDHGVL